MKIRKCRYLLKKKKFEKGRMPLVQRIQKFKKAEKVVLLLRPDKHNKGFHRRMHGHIGHIIEVLKKGYYVSVDNKKIYTKSINLKRVQ